MLPASDSQTYSLPSLITRCLRDVLRWGSSIKSILGALSFQLNCLIFLPGDKYFRMSSRKGKHWFQITSYLPDSFPYLCEAMSRAEVNAYPFAAVSIDSKIMYISGDTPNRAAFSPFAFLRNPESCLARHEVAHHYLISVWVPCWRLAVSLREWRGGWVVKKNA